MSYTSSWVIHVTHISWNDVAMKVHNRLSCGFAAVHANVVSIWLVFDLDQLLCGFKHLNQFYSLGRGEIKEGLLQLLGDN